MTSIRIHNIRGNITYNVSIELLFVANYSQQNIAKFTTGDKITSKINILKLVRERNPTCRLALDPRILLLHRINGRQFYQSEDVFRQGRKAREVLLLLRSVDLLQLP